MTNGGNIINTEEDLIKEMFSYHEYMIWLNEFSKKYISFNLDFNNESLSAIEKENIKKLGLFFKGIKRYAKKNFILPIVDDKGLHYNLKFFSNKFKLYKLSNPKTYSFEKVKEFDSYIDYSDIMNRINRNSDQKIKEKLDIIIESIKKLHSIGMTYEEIQEYIDELELSQKIKKLSEKTANF